MGYPPSFLPLIYLGTFFCLWWKHVFLFLASIDISLYSVKVLPSSWFSDLSLSSVTAFWWVQSLTYVFFPSLVSRLAHFISRIPFPSRSKHHFFFYIYFLQLWNRSWEGAQSETLKVATISMRTPTSQTGKWKKWCIGIFFYVIKSVVIFFYVRILKIYKQKWQCFSKDSTYEIHCHYLEDLGELVSCGKSHQLF